VHETVTFLLVTLTNRLFTDLKKFTDILSNKPFLIWLLTTPPHLKYVATLPCNLSSVANCFTDINFSQGSVATCKVQWDIHLTTNLPRNLPVKFCNRFIFELRPRLCGPTFLVHPVSVFIVMSMCITFRVVTMFCQLPNKVSPWAARRYAPAGVRSTVAKIAADLRPSADGSAVRTSLVADGS